MLFRSRPSVFIGSSAEGLGVAEAIQLNLDNTCEVATWCQGLFGLSEGTLETLVDKAPGYDFEIGLAIARVLCGGELESGSLVDENWFLALERSEFMGLLRNAKTQERVVHTLKTGKPLRN